MCDFLFGEQYPILHKKYLTVFLSCLNMTLSYIVFFPALIVIIAMIICYNQLVRKKNMMKEAWSGSFLELQTRLATIEGEIEMSRRYYNGTVRETISQWKVSLLI